MTSHTVDGVQTTYGYDNADQLTSESRTGYSASYTYDANGNRASRTVGGTTETYTTDSGDKLTSISVGGSTTKSYGYDAAGRTTSVVVTGVGTTTLSYDYESRVTQITYPNSSTNTFAYNGLSARTQKVDSAGTRNYKRDGVTVTSPVINDGAANYTPTLSERRSSTTTYLHAGLKNSDAQSGTVQTIGASRTYDAFGNVAASTGTWIGPFGYGGSFVYQADSDSGLMLLGYRYFDSSTGRFLTRDIARADRNWYVYTHSNALAYFDEDGLQERKIKGFTRHGINRVIGDGSKGSGVSNEAIVEAVKHGRRITMPNGTYRYVGNSAVVVLNPEQKVVTAWPRNSRGIRVGGSGLGVISTIIDGSDVLMRGAVIMIKYRQRIQIHVDAIDEDSDESYYVEGTHRD